MTEAKSPREIAEGGITDLDAANYAIDYFLWWMTWEQERANKAEACAAERERLLADADAALVHLDGGMCMDDCCPHEDTFQEAVARHKSRLRSRPATEGKRDD